MPARVIRRTVLLLTAFVALAGSAPALARTADARLTIRGAGFGHGVGMSQYGALGLAQKGAGYREILGHYYTGTSLGTAAPRTVRVLVASPSGVARFTGATRAAGRRLKPGSAYGARARGGSVDLLSRTGRRLATVTSPLRATSPTPIDLVGGGAYRGALEFRPAGASLNVINAVALESYLQGVVPVESPSSWPLDALKAQAVAARTYAITSSKGGQGFEHYADTRSQVYGGVGVEAASTTEAVRRTRGEIVTYGGRPAITYFFSTSGGRTEDVENTSLGSRPVPWLKSVEDPYDSVSPRHRWKPVRMSLTQAGRKLRGLVKGRFEGIQVIRRGSSPRVVVADVIGSGGRVRVTGAQLRARLGLLDTWAYFTTVSTGVVDPPPDEEEPAQEPVADPNGGVPARAAGVRTAGRWLGGRVLGARRGAKAILEIRTMVGWRPAGTTRIARDGRYSFGLCADGSFRVRVGSATGPAIRIR